MSFYDNLHEKHCRNCINHKLCESNLICTLVKCPNDCGQTFHECKSLEHLHDTCPKGRVPCINAVNGCKIKLPRSKLGSHLRSCPASVIVCSHVGFNRQLERSGSKWRWPDPLPSSTNECASSSPIVDKSSGLQLDPRQLKVDLVKRHCFKNLRRDEFTEHYTLIHNFLIPELDSAFATCAYYEHGCRFSERKFDFLFAQNAASRNVDPVDQCFSVGLAYDEANSVLGFSGAYNSLKKAEPSMDSIEPFNLLDLPYEILCQILKNLEAASLFNLSLTSKVLREICERFLSTHGIVFPNWALNDNKNSGETRWVIDKYRFAFSTHQHAPICIQAKRSVEKENLNQHAQNCVSKVDNHRMTEPYELLPAIPSPKPELKQSIRHHKRNY